MVVEHAVISISPGQESAFETAFGRARRLITAAPGCNSVSLSRSVETPTDYLLLVEWESVEAHLDGFRVSPEYEQWRALLHHHYAVFPTVEHFAVVSAADS